MMLNSLAIRNFRALADFKVSKLGRINLIVVQHHAVRCGGALMASHPMPTTPTKEPP
ncbi:MAG: hypothetical protein RL260_40 [Pseudomonadota bacterium]|jgi:hypothetical protein